MANTVSAKKMTRKIAKRTAVNRSRRSRVRTFIKKVEAAIASGNRNAAAEALRAAIGVPLPARERPARDRTLATLRARLDAETFAQAWAEGQALSLEQAMAVAMAVRAQEGGPGSGPSAADRPSPQAAPSPTPGYDLTRRETEVLRLLADGLTYAQIAEALVISPRTVDAHVRAIFGKLDVRSRGAATRVALEHRLI